VTLNGLERRNGRYLRYSTEFGSFGANYVKVVEDRATLSATKMCSRNLVFSDRPYDWWRYSQRFM